MPVADRGDEADGSQECDSAAVLSAPLGEAFPDGLLVVQDGHNTPDVVGSDDEGRGTPTPCS